MNHSKFNVYLLKHCDKNVEEKEYCDEHEDGLENECQNHICSPVWIFCYKSVHVLVETLGKHDPVWPHEHRADDREVVDWIIHWLK